MGAGLRPNRKLLDKPPDPAVTCAPHFYPDPQGAVASPLLANVFLHYVFDLWAHQWRRREATGNVVVVRYADDIVAGFEHEADARRFWDAMRTRFEQFGLELHGEKTRLLEFGFICGRTRRGAFQLKRKTRGDRMRFWRPFAITSSLGIGVPTRTSSTSLDDDGNPVTEQHPNVLKFGFALEYSLGYLHSFVKDVGLSGPLRNAVPIVEVALEKPINRGGGPTIGTINPGILFPGRTMQFGIEAVIPVNGHTGGSTGVLLQLHFFLDDLFPRSLGKPLIGD